MATKPPMQVMRLQTPMFTPLADAWTSIYSHHYMVFPTKSLWIWVSALVIALYYPD